jgi:predicted DNA-binding protein
MTLTREKSNHTKVTVDTATHARLAELKEKTGIPQAQIVKRAVDAFAKRLRRRMAS